MICQLQSPSCFITLKSVERKWVDLLKTFHDLRNFLEQKFKKIILKMNAFLNLLKKIKKLLCNILTIE
jgi:hypothetical protein